MVDIYCTGLYIRRGKRENGKEVYIDCSSFSQGQVGR